MGEVPATAWLFAVAKRHGRPPKSLVAVLVSAQIQRLVGVVTHAGNRSADALHFGSNRDAERVKQHQETRDVETSRAASSAAVSQDRDSGRHRVHDAPGDSGRRLGQGRRRGSQRADRGGRDRHRQPGHLRPGLLSAAAGRAIRGGLRRQGRSPRGRQENGRRQVRQSGLRHLSRHARTAGPQRHRRGADRHGAELARDGRDPGCQGRQGRVLREALHEEHRPEPGAGRDVSAARDACSRRARSGGTCRTLPSPASWLERAGSANFRRFTRTRPG